MCGEMQINMDSHGPKKKWWSLFQAWDKGAFHAWMLPLAKGSNNMAPF